MRIGVPSMGERGFEEAVGEHFGRVPFYTIVDPETDHVSVLPNTSEHMGGIGYAPDLLAKAGIDAMVCRGLGRRAIMLFEEHGIMVYVGSPRTVREAIDLWKAGQLQAATDENACTQHAFRKHEHHHHEHGH